MAINLNFKPIITVAVAALAVFSIFHFSIDRNDLNFEKIVKSVVIIKTKPTRSSAFNDKHIGSGVIISDDGYIATNLHVISGIQNFVVETNEGISLDANLIGFDKRSDLAILKVINENELNLNSIVFAKKKSISIGDKVYAIGDPFGLGLTVTSGIVSANNRNTGNPYLELIQTDAAVNPGNSGGALINEDGELVGITSKIFSTTGSFSGISFALPVDKLSDIASEIIKFGLAKKASLGNFSIRSIRILHNNQLKYCGEIVNYSSGPILDLFETHERLCILKINEEPMSLDRLRLVLGNAFPGDAISLTLLDDKGELHSYQIKTESI